MAIAGERNRPVVTAIPLKDMLRDKGPGVYLAAVDRADAKSGDEQPNRRRNWVLVSNLGLDRLYRHRRHGGRCPLARRREAARRGRAPALRAQQRRAGRRSPATPTGIARIPGGLLHGRGGDEPFAVTALRARRRFQLPRSRPRRLRPARPRRQRPAAARAGRRLSLYRSRHLPAGRDRRPDRAGARRQGRRDRRAAGDLAAGAAGRGRGRAPPADRRQARRLCRDVSAGARRAHRHLAGRVEARPERRRRSAASSSGSRISSRRSSRSSCRPPTGRSAPARLSRSRSRRAITTARPAPSWRSRRRRRSRSTTTRSRTSRVFTSAWSTRNSPATEPRSRGADDRCRRQVDRRLVLTDLPDVTRPLAATIRVSVFEPSGRAVSESLTRPIRQRPLAIGLRSPAGDDAVPEGQPAKRRDHRARRRRQAHRGQRAALGVAARDLGIRLVFGQRQLAAQIAGARPADRCRHARCRRRQSGDAVAAAAGRPLSLGGHRRRERRADRACASMSAGGSRPSCPTCRTSSSAVLDKTSYQPGETAKLFVKAPFAGEAELAIASDRILSLRSLSLPAEGATIEIPVDAGWGSGVYALVSAYRPQRGFARARSARGPGRAVGVAWLGIDASPAHARRSRSPRPMSRGRAARSRSRSRWRALRPARRPMSRSPRSTRRC